MNRGGRRETLLVSQFIMVELESIPCFPPLNQVMNYLRLKWKVSLLSSSHLTHELDVDGAQEGAYIDQGGREHLQMNPI